MRVCVFTDAMLLHQRYEVGLSEQLRRTRLSVHHLDSGGLELGALLIHWNQLAHTKQLYYSMSTQAVEAAGNWSHTQHTLSEQRT